MNNKKILLIVLTPSFTFGAVDLQKANYLHVASDIVASKNNFNWNLKRTYSSRSLFSGVFGFGWCSDLDVKLKSVSKNTKIIERCGIPIGNFKSTGSLAFSKIKNHKYQFGTTGKVVQIWKGPKEWLEIVYDERGRINGLLDSEKRLLRIETQDLDGVILSVTGKMIENSYVYSEETLIEYRSQSQGLENYRYDQLQNLVEIRFIDGSKEKIEYDVERDIAVAVQRRDGCEEFYSYQNLDFNLHLQTHANLRCGEREIKKVIQDFWYEFSASRQVKLKSIQTRVSAGDHRLEARVKQSEENQ